MKINTIYPTIISLTTIPSRIDNLTKIMKKLSTSLEGFKEIIINIPMTYKNHGIITQDKINTLNNIHSNINVNQVHHDYGPLTKLYPILSKFPIDTEMNLLILDDNEYYPDEIKKIAEIQDSNHQNTYTFYKYNYGKITIPQGVDIISFWYPNLKHFNEFLNNQQPLRNKFCFYVDDLIIANYCDLYGITIIQLKKNHENVWKINYHETYTLYGQSGKFSRKNSMKNCYNFLIKK